MSKASVFEYHPKEINILLNLPDGKDKIIQIKPGWAFGTGQHPTTKLCIEALENLFKELKPKKVLDVGCGSGVLAICAVALGADCATGLDIEFAIVEEAKSNAKKNGLSSDIIFLCASIEEIEGEFDLVLVNILSGAILDIKDVIKSRMTSNGRLILSGIREEQKGTVINGFSDLGLVLEKELSEDGWVALRMKKVNEMSLRGAID